MADKDDKQALPRTLGIIAITVVWVLCLEIVLIVGWELSLRSRSRAPLPEYVSRAPSSTTTVTSFEQLYDAYQPFCVQYIHPVYLFFFPFDRDERLALSNDVVSLDAAGFRGPGPEFAQDRKLAFLIGGSAAFGHYASSDAHTITGYLNRLQSEYHFVNAGVPSWNSTQELSRMAFQLLELEPDLVISYGGANDLAIPLQYFDRGLLMPPGTPESFDDLHRLVDDIRARVPKHLPGDGERLTSELGRLLASHRLSTRGEAEKKRNIAAWVRKYRQNLILMNDMATARGTRFVAVWQPMLSLHDGFRSKGSTDSLAHRSLEEDPIPIPHFFDLGDLFDPLPPGALREDELTDRTIFVDWVHLSDLGNELVAEHLWRQLRKLE